MLREALVLRLLQGDLAAPLGGALDNMNGLGDLKEKGGTMD